MTHPAAEGGAPATETQWSLVEAPGARHLLVMFPGIASETVAPETWKDGYLPPVQAHRLYFGSHRSLLFGPDGIAVEAERAVAVLRRESQRLGVPPDRIICLGHSYGASAALYVGLRVGATRYVIGAPALRLGTWICYLQELDHPEKAAEHLFDTLYEWSGIGSDPENQKRLDRLIADQLVEIRPDAVVKVFAAPIDRFFPDTVWLFNDMTFRRRGRCEVVLGDYRGHEALEAPYGRYLFEVLPELIAADTEGGWS